MNIKSKSLPSLILFQAVLVVCPASAVVIDFDGLSPSTPNGTGTGNYFNGYGFGASTGNWVVDGVSFETREFGPGFSYSNVNDTTTPGFTNQFAAITGSGISGSGNYALSNGEGAQISFSGDHVVESVWVTNTTYAYLSMLNGDQFAKQFGGPSGNDPDTFSVTFTGFDGSGAVTGSQEFFLGDYRGSNTTLIQDWTEVDLTGLGTVQSIRLSYFGTDGGAPPNLFTPTYVALDNLSITAVPEPGTWMACALMGGVVVAGRR
ncbi:MAG: DUF4465 domain-containing protein, partial [Planctomycetota bacterium]